MRLSVNRLASLPALILLSGCLSVGGAGAKAPPPLPTTGPAADYPVVIGEPFTVGSKTYEPADTLNYDEVGYAAIGSGGETRVAAAHKTLPLPSYAEVTDLETGRTILVRVETRGPMSNSVLVELTDGAAAQLGISSASRAAVRVRRVNPPEQERAALRQGGEAPARMEMPEPLRKVLRRKLAANEPLAAPGGMGPNPPIPEIKAQDPDIGAGAATVQTPPAPPAKPTRSAKPAKPAPVPAKPVVPEPPAAPVDATPPSPPVEASTVQPADTTPASPSNAPETAKGFEVQVAALSDEARAKRLASELGGFVTRPGKYWYVRLGPFKTMEDARGALEKAKGRGYSDARIDRAR